MARNLEDFKLHIRQKPNQQHPFEVKVPPEKLKERSISLDDLKEIIKDQITITDERGMKIRYLRKNVYLVCGPGPVPFNEKNILEIVVYGPKEDSNYSPKQRLSKNEIELASRIERMEGSLQNMNTALSNIFQRLDIGDRDIPSLVEIHPIPTNGQDDIQSQGTLGEINSFTSPQFPSVTLNKAKSLALMTGPSTNSARNSGSVAGELSMGKRRSNFTNKNQDDALHFAILYSNPLVDIVEKKNRVQTALLINDPVDFSSECASILQCLESHKKLLNVHIECARSDQFITIIKEKPLIMHIMCHGDFDTEKQEFFLEFENSRAELLRMYPSKLKELLNGTDLSDIQLVFINACHSEAVGRAFLELGVNCVVVSQSEHKINDEFAKVFSRLFYDELIEGKPLALAFENAKTQLKAININASDSCCCGHSHKSTCNWYEFYKTNGKFLVIQFFT
jgi:hypothetical protein